MQALRFSRFLRFPYWRRDARGATALEFALLATPMLWLVLGTVEFGRWMWMKQALQATAAEAARCMAVLNPSCASGAAYSSSNTTRYVQGLASAWGVSLTTAQITLNRAASSGSVTGLSEVQLSYSFQSVVSTFVPGLSGTMAAKRSQSFCAFGVHAASAMAGRRGKTRRLK